MVSRARRKRQGKLVSCTTWHIPLFEVVANGIIFKCPHCRGYHHLKREKLELLWKALEAEEKQQDQPEAS